jgi:hypothetical protein
VSAHSGLPYSMGGTSHKRPSDGPVSAASKKARADSPARRSKRSGKGVGGAADQLKRVGDAVVTGQKKKSDQLTASGEARNPMAPETPQPRRRTKQVRSSFLQPCTSQC